ncbi:MAG: Mpo1-like protein [Rhizobacter sp.]
MKTLHDQLSAYAAYHRDSRNIATHFVGIPMIVLGITVLLARAAWGGFGVPVNLAVVCAALSCAYYLKLDLRYGLVMTALLGAAVAVSLEIAALPLAAWLSAGIGLFVVGWVFQFVGHAYEGRKPAFVDDLMGLIIGPLFVLAEAGFLVGWRKDIEAAIAEATGPVRRPAPLAT